MTDGSDIHGNVARRLLGNRLVAPVGAANHHPDLENHHNRVRVSLHTWDEGGISEKDLRLAREVESASIASSS